MRFVTVEHAGREQPGVVDGLEVALLPHQDLVVSMGFAVDALGNEIADAPRVALEDVKLLAPLRRFRRDILCTGWNYWDHFEESKGKREGQDVDRPEHPTFFTKGPDVVIGPYDEIAYDPAISSKWDYEAELAVVIGKTGR
ncbi:MAG TPA: fumarylacetoacetate hydrolase family protein, partial [Kribbella sp.]